MQQMTIATAEHLKGKDVII